MDGFARVPASEIRVVLADPFRAAADGVVRRNTMVEKGPVLWENLTSADIGRLSDAEAMVIVPVGAIEQHGPHLPVGTDTFSAVEVARRAAVRMESPPAIVAPPVWWGFSPHHMAFPGTISLSSATFVALLTDLCGSIAVHGFQRILLLNGHGGNAQLVQLVAQEVMEAHPPVCVAAATYYTMIVEVLEALGESELGGMVHAGEMETSVMLAVRPDLLRMDRATDEPYRPASSFFLSDMRCGGPVFYPPDLRRDTRHGVLGVPTLGTAKKGTAFLEAAVSELVEFLREFAEIDVAGPPAEGGNLGVD
jgi:creatinine amidohydrolase